MSTDPTNPPTPERVEEIRERHCTDLDDLGDYCICGRGWPCDAALLLAALAASEERVRELARKVERHDYEFATCLKTHPDDCHDCGPGFMCWAHSRISEATEALSRQLQEAQEPEKCWTCGDPQQPAADCACDGTGLHMTEVQNMREECLAQRSINADLEARLLEARKGLEEIVKRNGRVLVMGVRYADGVADCAAVAAAALKASEPAQEPK